MAFIPWSDLVALAWFLFLWGGYTAYADRRARRAHSLRAVMHAHRERWMRAMLARENRMVDAGIVGNLLQNVSFFASTTLIILAGLITLLGASDKAIVLLRELQWAPVPTPALWELRLLALVGVFVHAFFKFTWALRQFNYCSVLIGAAPRPEEPGARDYALRAAAIATCASKDFNQGMRAYYLSLAALAWFLHPIAFMATTTLVIAVLYWREYHSRALGLLAGKNLPGARTPR